MMVPKVAKKLFLFGLCLFAVAVIVAGRQTQESSQRQEIVEKVVSRSVSSSTKELQIFDFSNYKRLFKRVYSGLEQTVRMAYFFARVVRVFISAIKFKRGEQSYYLAINKFSDASPQELARMRNNVGRKQAVATGKRLKRPETAAVIDSLDFGDDVGDKLHGRAKEPDFKKMNNLLQEPSELNRRKRRDAFGKDMRELPADKLINSGSNGKPDPGVQARHKTRAPSNNRAPKSKKRSGNSLIDEQIPIQFYYDDIPIKSNKIRESSPDWVQFESNSTGEKDDWSHQLPDEVFLDLRNNSKCFSSPRVQGKCGSCYAFAAIAIAEWMYCMETGDLVEFSEQYIIDCGFKYVDDLNGCDGGWEPASARFIYNFGLALREDYPYSGKVGECPYGRGIPLNKTGYIRANMPYLHAMPVKEMAEFIKYGPMYVAMVTDDSFEEYGGGVHGTACDSENWANHGVVVVGHGRENGREYWLIRNSYGVDWGEDGYYKLDKLKDSICSRKAVVFGSMTGSDRSLNAYFNY